MVFARKLAIVLLSGLLGNCAAGPDSTDVPVHAGVQTDISALLEMLPGVYSNFAQNHEREPDGPVTDVKIRQLKTVGEPVFLFARELRDQNTYSHDIYWLKPNRQTGGAEFHFTRLSEDELSLPMQDILALAWQRVLPGCVIPLKRAGDQFIGQTNPATCVFEHPLQGETRLTRSFSIGADSMTIKTGVQDAGNRKTGDETLLVLQKHRGFKGWASIRIETDPQADKPGEWQLSQVFNTRDDGRVSHLYDQQMAAMDYGLQLARLHRFDGEPPYYQLSVINLENGQTQAYQWFKPDSGHLNLNLDWFQADLEPIGTEEPIP